MQQKAQVGDRIRLKGGPHINRAGQTAVVRSIDRFRRRVWNHDRYYLRQEMRYNVRCDTDSADLRVQGYSFEVIA